MNQRSTPAKLSIAALSSAILALLLWSGTAIANKIAVDYMDGLTAGVLRSMLAGACALVIAISMKLPFPKSNSDRSLLFVSGVSSFAIWPMLLSMGISLTTAGHAALIMAMIPICTVLIMSILRAKFPPSGWWIGALIALSATTTLLSYRGFTLTAFADGSSITGDLLVLFGGVICAVGYVAGGKLAPKIGTFATTFWGLALALIVLVPVFILIAQRTHWQAVPLRGWLGIAWLTLLSSLAGYVLWFFALGRGGIGRISSMQLIMPVVTLLAAVVVLDEKLSIFLGLICLMIVLGTFLAQYYADR